MSATGMTPFECPPSYLPPLFPAEEKEIAVPSVEHHLRCCRRVWKCACSALLLASSRNRRLADRHRIPAPLYSPGQKVWLSARNFPLKTSSKKLSPCYLGPFEITAIVNPSAVKLKLPSGLRVHPGFHVLLLKPVNESDLCPFGQTPSTATHHQS